MELAGKERRGEMSRSSGQSDRFPVAGIGMRGGSRRERGNALVVSILLVSILGALTMANFFIIQKSSRHSRFIDELGALRHHAETGARLGLHELAFDVGEGDGNIGTLNWSSNHDYGLDQMPGTRDEGEDDGIPTPNEPGVYSFPIGPSSSSARICVHAEDSIWPNIKRIVSSAYDGQNLAAVEVFARSSPGSVPGVAAVFVEPGLILDLTTSGAIPCLRMARRLSASWRLARRTPASSVMSGQW